MAAVEGDAGTSAPQTSSAAVQEEHNEPTAVVEHDPPQDADEQEDEESTGTQGILFNFDDGSGKLQRVLSIEFVDNVGLQNLIEDSIHASAGSSALLQRAKCDCPFPHDLLTCNMLHRTDEALRISKTDMVRIKSLSPNPGLDNLLRNPKHRHQYCAIKKDHDVSSCRFLHKVARAVPVGRDKLGFLPEELLDNQGFRQLQAHPEWIGRWCTNTTKHEPKTCLFIHKAPKLGESIGRRNHNVSKEGKLLVKSVATFEQKRRTGRIVSNAPVPEFVRKQQELDRLVEEINNDNDASDEQATTSAEDETSAVSTQSNAPQHTSVVDSSPRSRKNTSNVQTLLSLHPALLAMLLALLVAFVVPFLPN